MAFGSSGMMPNEIVADEMANIYNVNSISLLPSVKTPKRGEKTVNGFLLPIIRKKFDEIGIVGPFTVTTCTST